MEYEVRFNKATIEDWFTDASHLCTILSIPLIFYSLNFYSYSVIAAAIFWFLALSIRKFRIYHISKNQIFLYFIFYLNLLLGLFYTENIKHGLLELETSFAIVAFPLLLYTTRPLKPILVNTALFLFVFSAVTACIVCHVISLKDIIDSQKPFSSIFFSEEYQYIFLSARINLHSSYLSFLIIIALFILVQYLIQRTGFTLYILLILSAYLLLFLVLLMARGPWIGLLTSLVLTYIFFEKHKHTILHKVALTLGFIFLFSLFVFKPLHHRFIDPIFEIKEIGVFQMRNESVSYHIKSWICSIQSTDSFWTFAFGHGLGDEIDTLVKCYANAGYSDMVDARFNAHNQYLSQFLKSGMLGVLIFVLVLIYYVRIAIKNSNPSLFFVLVLFIVMCLFESILNVSRGVYLFTFVFIFFDKAYQLNYKSLSTE